MASKTSIEWTEASWNVVVGCSIVSPGCTNCYAMSMAGRLAEMHGNHYAGLTQKVKGKSVWTGRIAAAPDHIWLAPLQRQKPTTWFVNSMSDLFHEDCPTEWIDRAIAIMALTPRHTYQILTKRPQVMRRYFEPNVGDAARWRVPRLALEEWPELYRGSTLTRPDWWPLPNVWLGTSTERQIEADARIPELLSTPAAIRFISAEPLLGPLEISDFMRCPHCQGWGCREIGSETVPCQRCVRVAAKYGKTPPPGGFAKLLAGLDWVIVGGESGPGARPMDPAWALDIVEQCEAADVPVFVKQMGARPVGLRLKDKKGGEPSEWPESLRIREMPNAA